ncbi:hypothetical protein Moror_8155 [Moniliophthora roreri MCA 2997]|uniref:Uncharacterized protein n=2 Tax=Moniliophthora roreri TaxID=221103 RepID=V2X5G8_MONRO|nr:hypothetical protein Moror_8155 [Moniliophthora roreri MCA 2997]
MSLFVDGVPLRGILDPSRTRTTISASFVYGLARDSVKSFGFRSSYHVSVLANSSTPINIQLPIQFGTLVGYSAAVGFQPDLVLGRDWIDTALSSIPPSSPPESCEALLASLSIPVLKSYMGGALTLMSTSPPTPSAEIRRASTDGSHPAVSVGITPSNAATSLASPLGSNLTAHSRDSSMVAHIPTRDYEHRAMHI